MATPFRALVLDPRQLPPNLRNSAYTFVRGDRGRGVYKSDTASYTYTVPTVAAAGWAAGDMLSVGALGTAGTVTLSPAGGVTLWDGTTSGAVTLQPGQVVTLWMREPNVWQVL